MASFTVKVKETHELTFQIEAADEDEAVDLALKSEHPIAREFDERALESVVHDNETVGESSFQEVRALQASLLPEPTTSDRELIAQLRVERDEADRRAGAAERKLAALEETERRTQSWLAEQKRRRGYGPHVSFDKVWSDTCAKADAPTGAGDLQPHEVERLWRATGLPEYFLGNGGSNTGLYAFAKALRNAKGPE